ncbi:ABC transporter permease [Bacillus salipaludis]|uniref:ABC transporter permease n=1 Tax=Bacillus salipaludis TaxID=2547811 RepID=UPI002E2131B5|nr:ABC transporter permease subunit [Bacillus salipaludis]
MSQWITLLNKELLEMWRNFKWIWVPITFILLGVQKPLSSYYLPQILDSIGNLPEGAKIEIPKPSAQEVFVSGLSEYSSLGVLIIVLTTMALIAGERKSGVAAMILVKPVSYCSFVTAKWVGALLLLWVSFFIGSAATWYYTGILFDWVAAGESFQAFFFYGLWFTVILTIALFFSAANLVPGVAGFVSLLVVIILSLASSSLSDWLEWSPAMLPKYANDLVLIGKLSDYTLPACLIAIASILILLALSIFIFRKKELAS